MKDIKWYRAWDIVYPVGIYYVLMNVATFVVCLIVPLTDESYGFIKVLTTLFVLPVVYVMYRNDQLRRGVQKAKAKDLFLDMRSEIVPLLGILVMAACAAVVLNNLISWTPLMKVSATCIPRTGLQEIAGMAWDDLGSCDIRNYFWHDAYESRAGCLCRIFGCLFSPLRGTDKASLWSHFGSYGSKYDFRDPHRDKLAVMDG